MPPQAQALAPQALPAPLPAANQIKINPFSHFIQGNKNLLATNLPVALTTLVVNFGVSALMTKILQAIVTHAEYSPTITTSQLLVIFFGVLIVETLITAYFYQLLVRAIVTGSRDEKVSFSSLFGFVATRYLKLFLINLMFGVGFFVAGFILGALDNSAHVVFLLGVLVVAVAAMMLSFRFGFVTFVGLDDEEPQSVSWILRRSTQLWHNSTSAVVVYVITGAALCIGIVLAFASVAGPTFLLNLITSAGGLSASGVLLTIFEVVIAITALAGFSEVYNEAKFKVDGGVMPTASALAAPALTPMPTPMPMAAPMPVMPASVVVPTPAIPAVPLPSAPQNVIVAAPVAPAAPSAAPVAPPAPVQLPPSIQIPQAPAQPATPPVSPGMPPTVITPTGGQPVMPVTTPEVNIEKPIVPTPPSGPVIG